MPLDSASNFVCKVRSLPMRALVWTVFLSWFVMQGARISYGSLELPNYSRSAVSKELAFSDAWLLARFGCERGAQEIFNALQTLTPRSEVVFVGRDNPNSSLLYGVLSALAWPRPVTKAEVDPQGQVKWPENSSPAAVFFDSPALASAFANGKSVGPMTMVRFKEQ